MFQVFIAPTVGGLLIGSAAVLLLYSLGRIAGISGILWGAVSAASDNSWRWWFLIGLITAPALYHQLGAIPFPVANPSPWWTAVLGGGLVGFGVKLGGGCTSGHGVCGIGRLSRRSLIATLVFMTTGIVTVAVRLHLLGGA
jgi:uncharacterized membrane protein YedE/YeeE